MGDQPFTCTVVNPHFMAIGGANDFEEGGAGVCGRIPDGLGGEDRRPFIGQEVLFSHYRPVIVLRCRLTPLSLGSGRANWPGFSLWPLGTCLSLWPHLALWPLRACLSLWSWYPRGWALLPLDSLLPCRALLSLDSPLPRWTLLSLDPLLSAGASLPLFTLLPLNPSLPSWPLRPRFSPRPRLALWPWRPHRPFTGHKKQQ